MTHYMIDVEATHLPDDLAVAEPISLAIVRIDDDDVMLDTLIVPEKAVPAASTAVHGITNEKALSGALWGDVYRRMDFTYSSADTFWAWNASADQRFLINACYLHGTGRLPHVTWRDAMTEYGAAFGAKRPNGEPVWWKPTAAYEQQFGSQAVALQRAHDALTDARMAAKLLRRVQSGEMKTLQSEQGWFRFMFTHYSMIADRRGYPYVKLHTVGGQTVNVFQRDWWVLTKFGLTDHSNMLAAYAASGAPVAVPTPCFADIDLGAAFPELLNGTIQPVE